MLKVFWRAIFDWQMQNPLYTWWKCSRVDVICKGGYYMKIYSSRKFYWSIFCWNKLTKEKLAIFLFWSSFNPNKIEIKIESLNKRLALYSLINDSFTALRDLNGSVNDTNLSVFCDDFNFKSLIRETKCYINPDKLSCIDLILTNPT